MTPQNVKVILTLLGVAAVVTVLSLSRPSEPVYQRKPLSYWTDQVSGREFPQGFTAIRSIGPQAVPWLMHKVRRGHAWPHRVYCAAWPHLPARARRQLRSPPSAAQIDEKVAQALSLLDASGVPALVAAFKDSNPAVRGVAAQAIGRMLLNSDVISKAAPALAALLNDPDQQVRSAALSALSKMGSSAKPAIPALITLLDTPRPSLALKKVAVSDLRSVAARLLGEIGPDARSATLGLEKLLSDPESFVRIEAAIALWHITRTTNSLPVLMAELEKAPAGASPNLLATLGDMGSAAKPAVPLILSRITNAPIDLYGMGNLDQFLATLKQIDPDSARLARRIGERNDYLRAQLQAQRLWRAQANHPSWQRLDRPTVTNRLSGPNRSP